MKKVYIGYDELEKEAYEVTKSSLLRYSPDAIVTPLEISKLHAMGLLRRPVDRRGDNHSYDLWSNAPAATDFAISRFLVPHLSQTGWALFVDCDMVFMCDVGELFDIADDKYAVMVVKHGSLPQSGVKMGSQSQQPYKRKNWSSVMLFNCDHPANQRLSLQDINERPGRDLHAFYWLNDSEIGELPGEYNWLVNVQPKPENPKIAHFTTGGPWIDGWEGAEHDDLWIGARDG